MKNEREFFSSLVLNNTYDLFKNHNYKYVNVFCSTGDTTNGMLHVFNLTYFFKLFF